MEKGFIRGKKAPFSCGKNRGWSFTEADIAACVRRRPWLTDIRKIQNDVGYRSYFRGIVLEEWARDPWYTARETAPMLDLKGDDPVLRYIHRGWLKAEKRPVNIDGEFIIRKSAIDAFLAGGIREKVAHEKRCLSRHNYFLGRQYMMADLIVKGCSSPASPSGQHKWDIDSQNHGRCVWCGAEKDFPYVPWYSARDEHDNKDIFKGAKRKAHKKERKMQIKTQEKPIVTVSPPLSTMPAETQKGSHGDGGESGRTTNDAAGV